MGLANTGAGFWHTAEYQASALPWVSGSVEATTTPKKITFPKVTKYIKLRPDGATRLGFTANGVAGSNYFTVASGTTETFDVRVRECYVMSEEGTSTFDMFVGLTLIDSNSTSVLTGSTENQTIQGSGWIGVG